MDWYSGKCDPYIIASLSPEVACPDKNDKRTKVAPHNRNPTFNTKLEFDKIEFRKFSLILTVNDAESFGNDDFVGVVKIPMSTLDSQDWIEKWYPLTDPEKKTAAKQLGGSVCVSVKFVYSEKLFLDQQIKTSKQVSMLWTCELSSLY